MKNLIKQFLLVTGLTALALLLVNSLGADLAFAQLDVDADQPGFIRKMTGGATDLKSIVLVIIDFFLGFLGLLAVIMVIYGGFLYVSSAGNEENVNKAKKILLYAGIGIIVIALSFIIVGTVFKATGGAAGAA